MTRPTEPIVIGYLGPAGTYTEAAATGYVQWRSSREPFSAELRPYPSIAKTLEAVASAEVPLAVVPVENSIQGSVTTTLDTLWQLDGLHVQQAIILPIAHVLIAQATELGAIETIYSHPQALAQCQRWIETHLPNAKPLPANSTTEALTNVQTHPNAAAISSERAARLYDLPVLAREISDCPGNCTRFWAIARQPAQQAGSHTAIAFSTINRPGSLLQPLATLAERGINLCRIESRPSKRGMGDYVFFLDLEAGQQEERTRVALEQLRDRVEILKVFGSYEALKLD